MPSDVLYKITQNPLKSHCKESTQKHDTKAKSALTAADIRHFIDQKPSLETAFFI